MQRAQEESMETLLRERVYVAVEYYSNALAQLTLRILRNQIFVLVLIGLLCIDHAWPIRRVSRQQCA